MSNIVARAMELNAAADYLSTGAVEIPLFEQEIVDKIRRESVALQRVQHVPATGHPHRYFEQTAVASAAAVDPRNISASATAPTRVERPAFIKAVTAQSNLSLFDKEVTMQQGRYSYVVAKDIDDIATAVVRKNAQMFWTGTDTSMTTPTTLEWMGAIPQIIAGQNSNPEIDHDESILDGLKQQVAELLSSTTYSVRPTAIYMNPLLLSLLEAEIKATHLELKSVEVAAGISCAAIATQVGLLPIIPDPFIPRYSSTDYDFTAPAQGKYNYLAVIVDESLLEIPVISGETFNPNPRIFQLGLTGNLAGQYVGVHFAALVVAGATYAHRVIAVER